MAELAFQQIDADLQAALRRIQGSKLSTQISAGNTRSNISSSFLFARLGAK